MNKLVLHHHYSRSAFDLSDNRNHGYPVDVTVGGGVDAPSFEFAMPTSIVRVPPSESLANLLSVKASVTFRVTDDPIDRRLNLIEGHLAFALFVEPDGVLTGTILDRNGAWNGARSAAGVVTPGSWHTAELQHDGVDTIQLFLDGAPVAAASNAPGPVRSPGPHGIAIGHWPESPGVYTFAGFIRDVQLFKYDPYRDINGMLDRCCIDRKALREAVVRLREAGETADSVEAKAREILDFAIELEQTVRGGDAAVAHEHQQLSAAAFTAFLRGDEGGYVAASAALAALAFERLTPEQAQDLDRKRSDLIRSLPLSTDELAPLVRALCWDRVGFDAKSLEGPVVKLLERQPHGRFHRKGR